jgi:hypothetical protein
MEYNPVYEVMLVAGGEARGGPNRNALLVDGRGGVNSLGSLPVHVNCLPESKLMCDPVSGEYIIQEFVDSKSRKKGRVYALHPRLKEWKQIPGVSFPLGVSVPLSTYGVIMICAPRKVYVYRHKPVWPGDRR